MRKSICAIDGCETEHEARGLCFKHYMRQRRHGDPTVVKHPPKGTGVNRYQKPNGYWAVRMYGHPLAAPSSGLVYQHRLALYEAIGAADHPCHWCGKVVRWLAIPRLEADHLDSDRSNNEPANLVPACRSCNALRGLTTRWAA